MLGHARLLEAHLIRVRARARVRVRVRARVRVSLEGAVLGHAGLPEAHRDHARLVRLDVLGREERDVQALARVRVRVRVRVRARVRVKVRVRVRVRVKG